MNKLIVILFIGALLLTSCAKNCWRCTAITERKYLYTKANDTIIVFYIEGSHPTANDSLESLGYNPNFVGYEEIPIDYSFCDGGVDFAPYKKCYRVK